MTAFYMYVSVCFCLTADRWAQLAGLPDQPTNTWTAHFLMEAHTVALLFAMLNTATHYSQLAPVACLLLVNWVVFIYLIITFALQSHEYDLVSAVYGSSLFETPRYAVVSVEIYISGVLTYWSRRALEIRERTVFAKMWILRKQLEEKERHTQELLARQQEMEALTRAFQLDGAEPPRPASAPPQDTKKEEELYKKPPQLKVHPPETKPLADVEDLLPNALLRRAMHGQKADWAKIRQMADQVRNPSYKLKQFFEDCVKAFPELQLFFVTAGDARASPRQTLTQSGMSGHDEYQRTVAALFAVYWLMRLDIDGRESFCFGVDEQWEVPNPPIPPERTTKTLFTQLTNFEKSYDFLSTMNWANFEDLVAQAGCSPKDPGYKERTMAVLVLTAIHDIMKVEALNPTVQPQHAPYNGYAAGAIIHDHDVALAYVLDHYPKLLPSFAGLPERAKKSVLFTQGKMQFNHGWFVQAEAPPGAMLSTFKSCLSTGAASDDIGLYFLHWLTDLAGAEGTPLGGAEKFVLRFPHAVLASFLWSMPFLGRLSSQSETAVVEDYLENRWKLAMPSAPVPTDSMAIARMRLLVMAQGKNGVVEAFDTLPRKAQDILATELQRTAIRSQHFKCSHVTGGPALLVYYGPALLQRCQDSPEDLGKALGVMALVLQAARELWPATLEMQGKSVIVQIGELKSIDILRAMSSPASKIRQVWILRKQNEIDGIVNLVEAHALAKMMTPEGLKSFRVLCLSKPFAE